MKKISAIFIVVIVAFSMVSCKSNNETYTQLSELAEKNIGVPTGTVTDTYVLEKFPNAKISYYNSVMDGIIAVKNNKVSAFAYDLPIIKNAVAKNSDLLLLDESISVDDYAFAVNLGNDELKQAIDDTIAQLKADGTYDDMNERWFPKEGDPKPMPKIVLDGKNGVLKFGTASITEPFSFRSGSEIVGFDIELAHHVAKKLGKTLEIIDMEFGAMIASITSGKSDFIGACITITDERKKSILFSEIVYQGGIYAVVKK